MHPYKTHVVFYSHRPSYLPPNQLPIQLFDLLAPSVTLLSN
jgi:hypothetical protein